MKMKKALIATTVIVSLMITSFLMPISISADPNGEEGGGNLFVYPGPAGGITTIKLQAWNAAGIPILLWVFKYDGTYEELLQIGLETEGKGVLQYLVYGTIPSNGITGSEEGFFVIGEGSLEEPWEVSINLILKAGHYFAVVAPLIPSSAAGEGDSAAVSGDATSNDGKVNPEDFLVKEFYVSDGETPWVRNVDMTCYQVWVNDKGNFEFVFWWEYRNNNWVKIYDMAGSEIFAIDMPYGNARFEADLPDGFYTVKTFHDKPAPLQTFVIGKP